MLSSDLFSNFILHSEKINIPHFNNLSVHTCQYDLSFYSADLFRQLNIFLPDWIFEMATKRQAEYLAGRYNASLALKHLGMGDCDILRSNDRSPIWPSNVLGSITHTHAKTFTAAAYCADYKYLGIDYEKIIDLKTAEEIQSFIINENEEWIRHTSNFAQVLTILFSAKESLYKALYPYVGHFFDFSAASIVDGFNEDQSFELKLNYSLNNKLAKDDRFRVWFKEESNHILTLIAM